MLIVALSGCFFESVHAVNWFFEDTPAGKALEQLKRGLRIPVSSFVHTVDFHVMDQWYYTTELSRILLVGEHRFFEHVRYVPAIGGLLSLPGPLFDNRFEYFIKHVGKSSQQELQEAIRDTILLTQYSTKSYPADELLSYLVAALQKKIVNINYQMKHDFTYDQESFRYMKKSLIWVVGLLALVVVNNKYVTDDDNKKTLDGVLALGLVPTSYKTLKGCYKVLATDPNACNQYLQEYEELLEFVQKLQAQFRVTGGMSFELDNGCIVTLTKEGLVFN